MSNTEQKHTVKELMQSYIDDGKMGIYSQLISWIHREGTEQQKKDCIEFKHALSLKKTFEPKEKNTRLYKHK